MTYPFGVRAGLAVLGLRIVKSRLASLTLLLVRLKPVWNDERVLVCCEIYNTTGALQFTTHLFNLLKSLFSFTFRLSLLLPSFHGSGAGPPYRHIHYLMRESIRDMQRYQHSSVTVQIIYLSKLLLALRADHHSKASAESTMQGAA